MDTDPNLAFRWLDVPVLSYEWYLIFGAVCAIECRLLWRLLEKRPFWLATLVALPAGSFVIVFGVIAFLPFHGLAALGLDHGTLVAIHLGACAVLALAAPGERRTISRPLAAAVAIVPLVCVLALAWGAIWGGISDPGLRLAGSFAAAFGLTALVTFLPLRRRAASVAPELSVTSR
jgi:hypothetical protein